MEVAVSLASHELFIPDPVNISISHSVENSSDSMSTLKDDMSEQSLNFTLSTYNINESISTENGVNFSSGVSATSNVSGGFGAEVMIPLYSLIFLLSIIGNALVIVTLAQNRRMRTVTNVFLLNLAIADLLLGVFCMPFTLIGQLLRDFIFGGFMCRLIPYFQAVSVSVGVWTLVAISLERYFAICRPLKSRIWQTRSHAYKMIIAVWILSLGCCLPIAVLSRLKPIRDTGRHKCREEWPDLNSEKAYNLLLVMTLLVFPLLVMALAYWLIAARLWRGLRNETNSVRFQPLISSTQDPTSTTNPIHSCSSQCTGQGNGSSASNGFGHQRNNHNCTARTIVIQWPARSNHRRLCCEPQVRYSVQRGAVNRNESGSPWRNNPSPNPSTTANTNQVQIMDYQTAARNGVRSTYTDKSVSAKKKVIRMLFVIVLEFFLCWTPLYVVNTWYVFDPMGLYSQIGATEIALIQLLAYLSSCCNPITYCFMNEKFRNAFLNAFGCRRRSGANGPTRSTDVVSASLNDSITLGRRSIKGNPRITSFAETSLTSFSVTNVSSTE